MKCLARRISLLDQRKSNSPRRIHIVTAVDEPDGDRQMVELVEAGVVGSRECFLCLVGKPLVQ